MKTRDRAIQKRTEPAFIEPMQCKPVTSQPTGEKWTFEIKFEGYRCVAVKRGSEITLFSHHRKVINRRFPGVVEALTSIESDFVLDGELVALRHFATGSGKSKGQFYTPSEVSRIMAKAIGISPANTKASNTAYNPTCGSGSLLLKVAAETGKQPG